MEFRVERRRNKNFSKYATMDVGIAKKFAEALKTELGDFLMGVVVFGSSARGESTKKSDIDVLVITDDTSYIISDVLIEGYRVIVENLVRKVSLRLHVTSMTFTSFWEHAKNGDPVIVNILRDGFAIIDAQFFEPLHVLLQAGKVRPSEESVWRYFGRAPKTLLNSRWHVLQATLDLYWAVIDAAHAALMVQHQVPVSPEHVADLLDKVYVHKKLLPKKYSEMMRKFYKLSKDISYRKIEHVSGAEYEKLYGEADEFVKAMKKLIYRKV